MTQLNNVLPTPGQPDNWNERHQSELTGITLPAGAVFYTTPSHGYLRVDFNILPASVSEYDYLDEPHHALLEEDCSLTMWLAEYGLIPMEDYILKMIRDIPRTSAYGLLHPGSVVIEPGIVADIDGKLHWNEQRIIAGTPHKEPLLIQAMSASSAR